MKRFGFVGRLVTLGILISLLASCSGGSGGGTSGGGGAPAGAGLNILEGAVQNQSSLPAPSSVSYTDKSGVQRTIDAYPGQTVVWFTTNTSLIQATNIITGLGGTILTQIPTIGYYLVETPPASTDAAFIATLLSNPSVKNAYPNGVIAPQGIPVVQSAPVGVIQKLNIPARGQDGKSVGSIIIDSWTIPTGSTESHADIVLAANSQTGGNPKFGVDVGQDMSYGAITSALLRVIGSSLLDNPGQPISINMSLGGTSLDGWKSFVENVINAIEALPAREQVVVTLALGNDAMNVGPALTDLKTNPSYSLVLDNNIILVGANDYSGSNVAPSAGCSVVQDSGVILVNNVQHLGTSFAAPRILGKIEKLLATNDNLSGSRARRAVKCACDKDPNITDANLKTCSLDGYTGTFILKGPQHGLNCAYNTVWTETGTVIPDGQSSINVQSITYLTADISGDPQNVCPPSLQQTFSYTLAVQQNGNSVTSHFTTQTSVSDFQGTINGDTLTGTISYSVHDHISAANPFDMDLTGTFTLQKQS